MNIQKGLFRPVISALSVLLLATIACNAPGAASTIPTPTIVPTPTISLPPTATEQATEEPEPGEGMAEEMFDETMDDVSSTTDGFNASFIEDVTVPDGTQFEGGATFSKTWRVSNSGTIAWPAGTQLVYTRGGQFGAPAAVSVFAAAPGTTTDITVQMTAPKEPGLYRSFWRMQLPSGELFGTEFFAEIVVVASATATPQATPTVEETLDPDDTRPDLLITSVALPDRQYEAEPFEMRIVVLNRGETISGASTLFADIQNQDDIEAEIPAIPPQETRAITLNLSFTDVGTFDTVLTVDSDTVVNEANEANNVREETLTINKADLLRFGIFDVGPGTCAELDTVGSTTDCNSETDFLWTVTEPNRTLDPQNDATFRVMGGRQPAIEECRTAEKSDDNIINTEDAVQMPEGTYLCYTSSEGNIGWVNVREYDSTIEIEFRTWDINE